MADKTNMVFLLLCQGGQTSAADLCTSFGLCFPRSFAVVAATQNQEQSLEYQIASPRLHVADCWLCWNPPRLEYDEAVQVPS